MRKTQRSAHFWIWLFLAPFLAILLIWAITFRQNYPADAVPTTIEEGH